MKYFLAILCSLPLLPTTAQIEKESRSIALPPTEVVEQFHAALQSGDEKIILELLAEDVLIYESGGAERSREEYAGHHLHMDIKFMKNMIREVISQKVEETAMTTLVFTESRTHGTFKNKDYNLLGKETVVLKQIEDGWKITHLHWSSMPEGK